MSDDTKKPRVKFCWECGRKLRGNHFAELEAYGQLRILHKECVGPVRTRLHYEQEKVF